MVLEILYTYVTGNQNALDTIAGEFQIKQCKHWIGFSTAAHRNPIYGDCISSYGDLYTTTSEIFDKITKDYVGRPTIEGEKLILV